MSHSSKFVIVVVLLLTVLCRNYGQDKSALRYNKEVNFEVQIKYLSGNEKDYKGMVLFRAGIAAVVMPMLDSAGIKVNNKIETPNLVLEVTADHNLKQKSSGDESYYFVTAEIYLIDKVKIIDHPSIKIETRTWQGDSIRILVSEKNIGTIRNEDIAKIIKSFINDYWEINRK